MPLAERKELRIAFDVRDEAEHLVDAVRHMSVGQKIRHRTSRRPPCGVVARRDESRVSKRSPHVISPRRSAARLKSYKSEQSGENLSVGSTNREWHRVGAAEHSQTRICIAMTVSFSAPRGRGLLCRPVRSVARRL